MEQLGLIGPQRPVVTESSFHPDKTVECLRNRRYTSCRIKVPKLSDQFYQGNEQLFLVRSVDRLVLFSAIRLHPGVIVRSTVISVHVYLVLTLL